LRDEVIAARKRYMDGAEGSDEFARVLKRFSAFVIDGTIPDDVKPSTGPWANGDTGRDTL